MIGKGRREIAASLFDTFIEGEKPFGEVSR